MSGLVKAEDYDWKDSNMALFGSDTDKAVKKESAETEPAWEGAGQDVGLKIWRIVKFEIKDWAEEEYGEFYNGDSYIVLNTYKQDDSDALLYDVHFWIGKNSTQDEYGTAAYKTVELDTLLDDRAIQHREVMGHESELFKSYFPNGMTILEGGAETGFRHVEPEEYQPRLFHVHGKKKNVVVREIPKCESLITDGDVYILDLGTTILEYIGEGANKDEKFKAMAYVQNLENERNAKTEVLDRLNGAFKDALTEKDAGGFQENDEVDGPEEKRLFKVSDATGDMTFEEAKTGEICMDDFSSDDVFIFDSKNAVFVYVGCNASSSEKRNSMTYAHRYLLNESRFYLPVSILNEGQKCADFNEALGA